MTDLQIQTDEKIRYAKWKASDIAKAFREGRRPTPGPPGWAEEHEEPKFRERGQEESPKSSALVTDTSSPTYIADRHSPPQTHFSSTHPNNASSKPVVGWPDPRSDVWNTAETQGPHAPAVTFPHTGSAISSTRGARISEDPLDPLARSGTGAHTIDPFSGSARGPLKKPAWTNEELEGTYTPAISPKKSSLKSGSPDSDKRVHFSTETLDAPPSPPKSYRGSESIYAPSTGLVSYSPLPPPPSNSPGSYIYASSPPRDSPPRVVYPIAPPFELTPEIIAKAQKRCRYAISALDYEDAETARKELREALALLEG